MDGTGPIRKVNMAYLLLYFLTPVAVFALCVGVSIKIEVVGFWALVTFFGPVAFAALWWILGGGVLYKQKKKQMKEQLGSSGFARNHIFDSSGCTVSVDVGHGKIAMLFRWNPFKLYVVPASRITRAWVDDGRAGAGFMEGSSRVSFLFLVDGTKVRVNTFTSNRRWSMGSDYILTGISKADLMVEVLNAAKASQVQ